MTEDQVGQLLLQVLIIELAWVVAMDICITIPPEAWAAVRRLFQ